MIYYSLAACDKYDLARHVWEVGHWIEGLREEIHGDSDEKNKCNKRKIRNR